MRVLVCGGHNTPSQRIYDGMDAVQSTYGVDELLHAPQGGDADWFASEWARRRKIPVITAQRTWRTTRPRRAARIRNEVMIGMKPDILIAFCRGSGTMDMIRRAKAAGIPVVKMDFS